MPTDIKISVSRHHRYQDCITNFMEQDETFIKELLGAPGEVGTVTERKYVNLLNQWEQDFIAGMRIRYAAYKVNLIMSKKQLESLQKIYTKLNEGDISFRIQKWISLVRESP